MTTGTEDRLHAIGFWKDSAKSELPDPAGLVGHFENEMERGQMVEYLRGGVEIDTWRGWSYCRFECGIADEQMGHAELSDGHWVWPEGLAHYVERHGLMLPSDFVEHARRNSFSCPPTATRRRYDSDFWIAWARERAQERAR